METKREARSGWWRAAGGPSVWAEWALVFTLLVWAHAASGQCALARTPHEPKACGGLTGDETLVPEDGYLSSDKYTSQFFGFSIDLPISSEGHRINIPVMMEKHHALLALGFEQWKRFGTLTITAEEEPQDLEMYDDQQGAQCEDSLGTAPTNQKQIPGHMLHYGAFYANVHHRGPAYTSHYWTRIKNYIIRVAVDSNDHEFLEDIKHALMEADFYCTRNGKLTDRGVEVVVKGEPYEGPTVPTWRVDAAIRDKPALGIPAGEISESVYRNPELGFQYELPKGWEVLKPEPSQEPPGNDRALREYELLHACSRTLLRAAAPVAGDEAQQRDRPAIVLRAIEPSCLSARVSGSVADRKIAPEIGANLQLFTEFGQVKSNVMASFAGRPFMIFRGTVGARTGEDQLSRRMTEVILATLHHDLVFLWSVMAPSASDLDTMPAGSVTFDDGQPIELLPAKGVH